MTDSPAYGQSCTGMKKPNHDRTGPVLVYVHIYVYLQVYCTFMHMYVRSVFT